MNLDKLFSPSSIAIVGASDKKEKVGHLVLNNLLEQGYKGELYFVNKNGGEIMGKKVYLSVDSIGKPIDLVLMAVPAEVSLALVPDLNKGGVTNVVMYAAGFGETGKEGKELEEKLKKTAVKDKISILGPNCIGYINSYSNINTTFLKKTGVRGNIGIISQSGALGSMLMDYFAGRENLGISYFVSLGNKTVIDESDVLEFMMRDMNTKVIGMYLEDIKSPEKMTKIAERCQKTIIVLKGGKTREGSKAALSHTGGLLGDDNLYTAFFRQNGIIRADNINEFITFLRLYSFDKVPKSKNVLVLSNAGGAGVLLTDELIRNGLNLVTISEKTKEKIIKNIGESRKINVRNPIDLLGDASAFMYEEAIKATENEKDIGSVTVLLTPQANTQIEKTADLIINKQESYKKPIYPIFMGEVSVKNAHKKFETKKLASFYDFDFLPRCVAKIIDNNDFIESKKESIDEKWIEKKELDNVIGLLRRHLPQAELLSSEAEIRSILKKSFGLSFLNLFDSLLIMRLAKFPMADFFTISSEQDLKISSEKIGYPSVLKISSEKITHKTEVSGVVLDRMNYAELLESYKNFASQGYKNCILQKQIKGHEIFLGAKKDKQFGVCVVIGIGGVFAELIAEIEYFLYPYSFGYFKKILEKTKIIKIINGYRGSPAVSLHTIYELTKQIAMLLSTFEEIESVDLNPVILSQSKSFIADARIILEGYNNSPA